ncbi:DsbA family protein [Natronorubrum sulfidifaciens]|uniref:Disulfide bond formation protein n=1 Tax=Natronorubrum sulfidifaciens JCM 14089 TaxID=1230460 RepID=L9W4S8_9EURY|nr:thioredoxin domain-containing protein [Natronorubrum sulfidifaciens]ELY43343.1 disulfide bond formation protein [Natronorubrum sulfidifaciens JCM 14089]
MKLTRRTVLGTAAAVSVGTGIAGCLGSEDPPEPPVLGDPDADVTVTVYEDFSCPSCQYFKEEVFPDIEEAYIEPEQIRYEHRNYPIPVDDTWSWAIACAAREVYETEGNDAFWAFATDIYDHLGSYSYDAIETVANDLDLDGSTAREAAEEETHRSLIEDDKSYGSSNGVEGTPAVFIDGDQIDLTETNPMAEINAALE